jgi:V/A-type H+/Na+-transporting ATPase subunit E
MPPSLEKEAEEVPFPIPRKKMAQEVSIQSLLERIKEEGIDSARAASEEILREARGEAESLLEEARKEAREIRIRAEREIERDRRAFEAAMAQSGRDLIIGLKRQIIQLCERILQKEVRSVLTPETLKEILLRMIDRWEPKGGGGTEILLNEGDLEKLEDLLYSSLQKEFREGLVLRPVDTIQAGFHIGREKGSMYYDLTDEGLAEILGSLVNPRVSRFLQGSAPEGEG